MIKKDNLYRDCRDYNKNTTFNNCVYVIVFLYIWCCTTPRANQNTIIWLKYDNTVCTGGIEPWKSDLATQMIINDSKGMKTINVFQYIFGKLVEMEIGNGNRKRKQSKLDTNEC